MAYTNNIKRKDYKEILINDLQFINKKISKNVPYFLLKTQNHFKKWSNHGYNKIMRMIMNIKKVNYDAYRYAIMFYVNGFQNKNMYIEFNNNQTIKICNFDIMYRNNNFYINNEKIKLINNSKPKEYYKKNIVPFWGNKYDIRTLTRIIKIDNNPYIDKLSTITLKNGKKINVKFEKTISNEELIKEIQSIYGKNTNMFLTKKINNSSMYIKIPSFDEDEKLFEILNKMDNIKKYSNLVIDLSFNNKGNNEIMRSFVRILFTDDYLKKIVHDYNKKFETITMISKDKIKKDKEYYNKSWNIYDETKYMNKIKIKSNEKYNGNIYIISNGYTTNIANIFINDMLQIPNVYHIGSCSNLLTDCDNINNIELPSGLCTLYYPIEISISHKYPNIIKPKYIYKEDYSNEEEFNVWLNTIINSS
jgi:hypothetical protein